MELFELIKKEDELINISVGHTIDSKKIEIKAFGIDNIKKVETIIHNYINFPNTDVQIKCVNNGIKNILKPQYKEEAEKIRERKSQLEEKVNKLIREIGKLGCSIYGLRENITYPEDCYIPDDWYLEYSHKTWYITITDKNPLYKLLDEYYNHHWV